LLCHCFSGGNFTLLVLTFHLNRNSSNSIADKNAILIIRSFANEITSVDEAKKYYSLFGLMANVALIFSGQYVKYVSNLRVGLPPGTDLWGNSLKLLMGAVVGCGALIMAIMAWMQKSVLTDPECVPPVKRDAKKKKVSVSRQYSNVYINCPRCIQPT
jgi:ATP:ADP antiporter, AAA family